MFIVIYLDIYSSTSNEDRTDNDIFELGKNLAEEVTRFIQNQI
jgi:hypothetical protein